MQLTTAPPPTPAPGPLARLDAAIAAARAKLDRLVAAREVMIELEADTGTPREPLPAAGLYAAPALPAPPAKRDGAAEFNAAKSANARAANRLALARVILEDGPQPANALFRRFPGRGHGWIMRTCKAGADWFVRVGERPGGVDSRPWGLTPQGRTEAAAILAAERHHQPAAPPTPTAAPQSRPKPRDPKPAPEPPADRDRPDPDPRPNAVLDAAFAEDLFLKELGGGKPTPRPGLNGTRGHRPPATANGRH